MSIQEAVRKELAAWPSFSGDKRELRVRELGAWLSAEITALDTLACSFVSFTLTVDALAPVGIERLKSVAENLSRRLTYLLEPISAVEIDHDRCVVQLRSNPPQRGESSASYYELLVQRPCEIRLCRHEARHGAARQVVEAHVTREVLARLAADFAAAAE